MFPAYASFKACPSQPRNEVHTLIPYDAKFIPSTFPGFGRQLTVVYAIRTHNSFRH